MPRKLRAPKSMFSSASELEAAFYAALSAGDVDALMKVWSEDEDIICILPNLPYTQGHVAVRELWEMLFNIGRMNAHILATHTFDNLLTAVHTLLVHIQLTTPAGETQTFNLHTTQVYLKSEQGWCMSLYHATIAQDNNKLADVLPNLLH
ncbi:YybH family protein [Hydromonas duriensis]|nr:nuclear transport factor 2 family protein [Hydromonas duriensis]